MIAKDRGRGMWPVRLRRCRRCDGDDLAGIGHSRTPHRNIQVPPPAPANQANAQYQSNVKGKVNVNDINVPGLKPTRIPVQSRRPDRDRQRSGHYRASSLPTSASPARAKRSSSSSSTAR